MKQDTDRPEMTHVFVRGEDNTTYVINPEVLEAFSLEGSVLLTIAGKHYAIPKAVVELQPLGEGADASIDGMLDEQEVPKPEDVARMTSVWNILPYTACFYGGWAGGGNAVAAADYCEARYPFS
ncbi:MAG TPA: hypothetical protein VNZ58_05625 [Thermomicrobiales bacterium]|nr:hypothetical protein [Thermomicrobiales bacterium]